MTPPPRHEPNDQRDGCQAFPWSRVPDRIVNWGVTAPDPQTFDVVDAEAADVETLFEIYLDVVAAGGADPAGGEAIRDVFVEGWIRRRRVYAARRDGVTVGGYFLRTNFPAMAGHITQAGYLVARSERGRGIGTRLLAHFLEEAARHGYRAMMFNLVQEGNPSRRLYERAGFQDRPHPAGARRRERLDLLAGAPECRIRRVTGKRSCVAGDRPTGHLRATAGVRDTVEIHDYADFHNTRPQQCPVMVT
ncbi:hypothetical protein BH20ACT5_BH20ACT5_12870 [soil metagenome]